MKKIRFWFLKCSEGVAAAMLAAMFFTFLLQIFSRYVLAEPFGWTLELCLTLWVWIVFWGNAFVVKHEDHVAFDVLYLAVRDKTRRVFALIGAAATVIALGVSLYPTWDYIDFLKIKKSATLHIPMRTVFSIYAIFIIAVCVTYFVRFVTIVHKGVPEQEKVDS
ncbi:MAG: TRAP transporter small permease [Arenicella sp.]